MLGRKSKLLLLSLNQMVRLKAKLRVSECHASVLANGRAWAIYVKLRVSECHASVLANGRAWAIYVKLRVSECHASVLANGRAWAIYVKSASKSIIKYYYLILITHLSSTLIRKGRQPGVFQRIAKSLQPAPLYKKNYIYVGVQMHLSKPN